jgi:hypothetical protein
MALATGLRTGCTSATTASDARRHQGWQWMAPPQIITFFCEYYISPDRFEDQRLRMLAP